MSNKNDERIMLLKKQIEIKKEKLKVNNNKKTPITNSIIDLDGIKSNLNVLSKEQLVMLLVKLNAYRMSLYDLGMKDINISGYDITEWIEDIKNKLDLLTRREEEKQLRLMEEKLTKLLSEGKKVELEIDEIENLLK